MAMVDFSQAAIGLADVDGRHMVPAAQVPLLEMFHFNFFIVFYSFEAFNLN